MSVNPVSVTSIDSIIHNVIKNVPTGKSLCAHVLVPGDRGGKLTLVKKYDGTFLLVCERRYPDVTVEVRELDKEPFSMLTTIILAFGQIRGHVVVLFTVELQDSCRSFSYFLKV